MSSTEFADFFQEQPLRNPNPPQTLEDFRTSAHVCPLESKIRRMYHDYIQDQVAPPYQFPVRPTYLVLGPEVYGDFMSNVMRTHAYPVQDNAGNPVYMGMSVLDHFPLGPRERIRLAPNTILLLGKALVDTFDSGEAPSGWHDAPAPEGTVINDPRLQRYRFDERDGSRFRRSNIFMRDAFSMAVPQVPQPPPETDPMFLRDNEEREQRRMDELNRAYIDYAASRIASSPGIISFSREQQEAFDRLTAELARGTTAPQPESIAQPTEPVAQPTEPVAQPTEAAAQHTPGTPGAFERALALQRGGNT